MLLCGPIFTVVCPFNVMCPLLLSKGIRLVAFLQLLADRARRCRVARHCECISLAAKGARTLHTSLRWIRLQTGIVGQWHSAGQETEGDAYALLRC